MSESLVTPRTIGRLLCPWNFPGKNTGVGSYFLLQEIPTQGSDLCVLSAGGFFTNDPPRQLELYYYDT